MKKAITAVLWVFALSNASSAADALLQLQIRAGTVSAAQRRSTAGAKDPDTDRGAEVFHPAPPDRQPDAAFSGDVSEIVSVWQKACGEAAVYSNPGCRIHECDLLPSNCRPGRLLLFRGETGRNDRIAVSGLYRTVFTESDFYSGGKNPVDLAGQLKRELEVIRPMKQVPKKDMGPYENQIALVRSPAKNGWFWRFSKTGDEDPSLRRPFKGKYAKTAQEAFSFMETVFYLHKNGPFPNYKDPVLGIISIDPFVSFSLNAEDAIGFPISALYMESAINGSSIVTATPYLIIISVPESEIVTQCGEEPQEPGTVLDPARNCRGYNDYNEHELAAFMFAKPEYILGSLPMPKDFVEAWHKRGELK